MKLKIATWNMGHWQHINLSEKAWRYLDNEISPDIALVQEAVPFNQNYGLIGIGSEYPTSFLETHTILWREIGGNRKWGSGIFTKGLPIREMPLKTDYHGALIVGEVLLPDKTLLTFISLYALMENGYSITTLHRMFSDLTLLLDGKMGDRRIVLGGDFNASLQWDKQQSGESHRIMFERLENFNLINCLPTNSSEPVQTWRSNRGHKPWQLDYIFVSKNIQDNLLSCNVLDNDSITELSDHNPIIIEMDI